MTETKLSPQRAFECIKELWPDTTQIVKSNFHIVVFENDDVARRLRVAIDWPDGVTEWPPNEKWRPAKPEDIPNRPACRVKVADRWFNGYELSAAQTNRVGELFFMGCNCNQTFVVRDGDCEVLEQPPAPKQDPMAGELS